MFTLSEKIRVINSDADIQILSATGVLATTTAAIVASGTPALDYEYGSIAIPGFGKFPISAATAAERQIVSFIKATSVAPTANVKDFTVVSPTASLAIGDAIEVIVSIETSRYQSDVLTTNQIGGGRTVKFSTAPLAAIAATDIRTAIVAGWATYKDLFAIGTPSIEVTASAVATNKVRVAAAPGFESITITKVEIKRVAQGAGFQTPVKLVETLITAGTEGRGTGKFLEESVRMATGLNNDPYGIDTTGTQVDLRGTYTEYSFTINAPYTEKLSTLAADNGPLPATHKFVLYVNEVTGAGTNGAIARLDAAFALV